jgi:dephospho-CoA kinase
MNESQEIKDDLILNFGIESILSNGTINTAHISKVVFNNQNALKTLNSIVHPRVKDDVLRHVEFCKEDVLFIESAILLQSNLLDIIDGVWFVDAPENTRIERVMKRNSMSEADVKRRILAQRGQDYSILKSCKTIVNDDKEAVLPQVLRLISEISL